MLSGRDPHALGCFVSFHARVSVVCCLVVWCLEVDVPPGGRYKRNEIYTSISKILVAVNPYQYFDLYSEALILRYRETAQKRNSGMPPHVFSVSQAAYFQLQKYGVNQSMIVCGESGSGKTESAKQLMRYLAFSKEAADVKICIEKHFSHVWHSSQK